MPSVKFMGGLRPSGEWRHYVGVLIRADDGGSTDFFQDGTTFAWFRVALVPKGS
jgi:hypothetical protein